MTILDTAIRVAAMTAPPSLSLDDPYARQKAWCDHQNALERQRQAKTAALITAGVVGLGVLVFRSARAPRR